MMRLSLFCCVLVSCSVISVHGIDEDDAIVIKWSEIVFQNLLKHAKEFGLKTREKIYDFAKYLAFQLESDGESAQFFEEARKKDYGIGSVLLYVSFRGIYSSKGLPEQADRFITLPLPRMFGRRLEQIQTRIQNFDEKQDNRPWIFELGFMFRIATILKVSPRKKKADHEGSEIDEYIPDLFSVILEYHVYVGDPYGKELGRSILAFLTQYKDNKSLKASHSNVVVCTAMLKFLVNIDHLKHQDYKDLCEALYNAINNMGATERHEFFRFDLSPLSEVAVTDLRLTLVALEIKTASQTGIIDNTAYIAHKLEYFSKKYLPCSTFDSTNWRKFSFDLLKACYAAHETKNLKQEQITALLSWHKFFDLERKKHKKIVDLSRKVNGQMEDLAKEHTVDNNAFEKISDEFMIHARAEEKTSLEKLIEVTRDLQPNDENGREESQPLEKLVKKVELQPIFYHYLGDKVKDAFRSEMGELRIILKNLKPNPLQEVIGSIKSTFHDIVEAAIVFWKILKLQKDYSCDVDIHSIYEEFLSLHHQILPEIEESAQTFFRWLGESLLEHFHEETTWSEANSESTRELEIVAKFLGEVNQHFGGKTKNASPSAEEKKKDKKNLIVLKAMLYFPVLIKMRSNDAREKKQPEDFQREWHPLFDKIIDTILIICENTHSEWDDESVDLALLSLLRPGFKDVQRVLTEPGIIDRVMALNERGHLNPGIRRKAYIMLLSCLQHVTENSRIDAMIHLAIAEKRALQDPTHPSKYLQKLEHMSFAREYDIIMKLGGSERRVLVKFITAGIEELVNSLFDVSKDTKQCKKLAAEVFKGFLEKLHTRMLFCTSIVAHFVKVRDSL